MRLEGITLEFSGGVTVKLWPQWSRVAVLSPFGDHPVTLSFKEFERALKLSRKRSRKRT